MSHQTPDEAVAVLARHLQVEPASLAEWSVQQFREGYSIAPAQVLVGSPVYIVLGEQVGTVNLAHAKTSKDAVYERLAETTAK